MFLRGTSGWNRITAGICNLVFIGNLSYVLLEEYQQDQTHNTNNPGFQTMQRPLWQHLVEEIRYWTHPLHLIPSIWHTTQKSNDMVSSIEEGETMWHVEMTQVLSGIRCCEHGHLTADYDRWLAILPQNMFTTSVHDIVIQTAKNLECTNIKINAIITY